MPVAVSRGWTFCNIVKPMVVRCATAAGSISSWARTAPARFGWAPTSVTSRVRRSRVSISPKGSSASWIGMEKTADSVIRARALLGTFVEITARGAEGRQLERAVDAAFAVIERIHGLMSYHEPDSDVSRLNRANRGAPVVIHEWTASVLKASIDL